jgi:hypothetical protein
MLKLKWLNFYSFIIFYTIILIEYENCIYYDVLSQNNHYAKLFHLF